MIEALILLFFIHLKAFGHMHKQLHTQVSRSTRESRVFKRVNGNDRSKVSTASYCARKSFSLNKCELNISKLQNSLSVVNLFK